MFISINVDEDSRAASAVTAVDITRFATDRMNAIASEIVPLIYVGEHDPDKNLQKLWKDAWENLTSGNVVSWIKRSTQD